MEARQSVAAAQAAHNTLDAAALLPASTWPSTTKCNGGLDEPAADSAAATALQAHSTGSSLVSVVAVQGDGATPAIAKKG